MVFFCTVTVFSLFPFYRDFVDLAWWQAKLLTRLSRENIFNDSEYFQKSSCLAEMKKKLLFQQCLVGLTQAAANASCLGTFTRAEISYSYRKLLSHVQCRILVLLHAQNVDMYT